MITGGGTGIGRALAKGFDAKGWQVIIVGGRSELLLDVVSQNPDSIRAITADVGKHEDLQISRLKSKNLCTCWYTMLQF